MPRTPFLHPDEYFASRRPDHDLARAALVVCIVAVATTAAVGAVGWAFTQQLDVMIPVDNPAHTPDWACENYEEMEVSSPAGCADDVPETTQVNLGDRVWEEFRGYLPFVFVGVFAAWLGAAVLAHLVTAVAGGEGSFAGTLAVSGWAAGPNLLQVVLGGAVAVDRIRALSLSSDPDVAVQQLQSVATFGDGLPTIAILLLVTVWKAFVWAAGLRRARNVTPDAARAIAAVAAAVAFFSGLAS